MEKNSDKKIDLREKGRTSRGEEVFIDKRLYMQLFVYSGVSHATHLINDLEKSFLPGVLYNDLHDPSGIGILFFAEEPEKLAGECRAFLLNSQFNTLHLKSEMTLLGKTYALGYEPDVEDYLINRPRQLACEHAWALWYPLRRTGSFAQLSSSEQRTILGEHGKIGHAFGSAGYAKDIRLASYGLDKSDNDFVIGLLGDELHPLSSVVQHMRATRQTSLYIDRMGPFFVGRAIWNYRKGLMS
ncbi:MAG: hypothetical protein GF398_20365 [Chitinivibrionales bacterium]|nr:hypothetical protein [Chitinivibrionales bacterium]